MPDRVAAMCRHLFDRLVETGGPEQKTIVSGARDRHADDVAANLNHLYADGAPVIIMPGWSPMPSNARAASAGNAYLADLRGSSRRYFVATTVDLLTTGVDVPCVSNIVFFKYVRSPIAFYQMVGRGTRLIRASGKLMFRVYDYTDASRLFGKSFVDKHRTPAEHKPRGKEEPTERVLLVEGFQVRITDAGR